MGFFSIFSSTFLIAHVGTPFQLWLDLPQVRFLETEIRIHLILLRISPKCKQFRMLICYCWCRWWPLSTINWASKIVAISFIRSSLLSWNLQSESDMKLVIVQLVFLLLPAFIYSKCCYNTGVVFRIEGDESLKCSDFGAKNYIRAPGPAHIVFPAVAQIEASHLYRACKKSVCGDGETKADTNFCGIGKCNWIGCDCEGGCIEGDPQASFLGKHGANVSDLGIELFDSIRNAVLNN